VAAEIELAETPRASRAGIVMLWVGTLFMVLATLFPIYSQFLF